MTAARAKQINLDQTRYYHAVSCCVRRAFLCGHDSRTGRNFDHRKPWLLRRLRHWSSIFAIDCAACGLMANHWHAIVHVDVDKARRWTDEEVIVQWGKLYPNSLAGWFAKGDPVAWEERETLLPLVPEWRHRLSSVSWFMKCVNEFIAHRANAEHNCRGHFWESRFRCQALLDEVAVLGAMCYVDLNPIRVGIAQSLGASDYTSVQERLEHVQPGSTTSPQWDQEDDGEDKLDLAPLMPFRADESNPNTDSEHATTATPAVAPTLPITLHHYLVLVDWTGRQLKPGKRGRIAKTEPPHPHTTWRRSARVDSNHRAVQQTLSVCSRCAWKTATVVRNGRACWVQGGKTAARLYRGVV